MVQFIRKNKVVVIAGAAILCAALIMSMSLFLAQARAEDRIDGLSIENDDMELYMETYRDTLYKDTEDSAIVRKVCEKYNLDYDTVKIANLTREMRNYEYALWLKSDYSDSPLLEEENKTEFGGSLEIFVNDSAAFYGGKDIVMNFCNEVGIDPYGTVINDLTEEQIAVMIEEAYQVSDHKDL